MNPKYAQVMFANFGQITLLRKMKVIRLIAGQKFELPILYRFLI